jgi:hypothetical protein
MPYNGNGQEKKYSNPKWSSAYYHPFQSPNLWVYVKSYYGFLSAHHVEMNQYRDYFPCFEITLSNETYGLSQWQQTTNYPKIGISYMYTGLGANEALGQAHAIIPHMNFPIYGNKNFHTYFHMGIGVAYLTNKFDPIDNYENIIIGSHINVAINAMVEAHYKLNKYYSLSFGATLIHFSNGSIKTPNFGINIPSLQAGIGSRITYEDKRLTKRRRQKKDFEPNPNHKITANVGLIMAPKNTDSELGQRFFVYNLYADFFKTFNFNHRYGLGVDLSYDQTDILVMRKSPPEDQDERELLEREGFNHHFVRVGINASYELDMYPVIMSFSPGVFVYRKRVNDGMIYEKLDLKYFVYKDLYLSLSFRAHSVRADYLGLGVGFNTNLWRY